jgi:hypothetical protein
MVDSWNIPEAREKWAAPVLAWGGGISVSWGFGKTEKIETPKPVEVQRCDSSKELLEKLRAQINGKDGSPGLKDQIADYEKKIIEKRSLLKSRKVDPLDDKGVLTVLRDQRAAELSQKDLDGLDPEKDKDKINDIMTKANAQAEKDFPNVEKFWNPEPHTIDEKSLVIPNPLPEDCNKLTDLVKTVTKGRDNLAARLEGLKKANDTPFNPRIRELVTKVKEKVLPSLKDIHFEDARPYEAEYGAFIQQLKSASNGGKNKVDYSSGQLKMWMDMIFGPAYVSKVIQVVKDTAEALNEDYIKDVKDIEVQGYTSKAGGQAYNLPLSDRRANMVMALLIAEGVDQSRLRAKGFGYTPETAKTSEENIPWGTAEAAAAAADNRRIEIVIPESEIKRIEAAGGTVMVGKSNNQPDDEKKK